MASRASRRLARLISTPLAPSCRSPISAARDELASGCVCGGSVSIAALPVTAAAAAGASAPGPLQRSQVPVFAAGAGMRSSNSTSFQHPQAAAAAATAAAATAAQASTAARARTVLPAAAAVSTGASVAACSQAQVGSAARCTGVRLFSAAAGAAAAAAASGAQKSRFPRKRLLGAAALAGLLGGGVVVSTQDPGTISEWWFRAMDFCTPAFHLFDPETAHDLAIFAASLRLLPHEHRPDPPVLGTTVWGRAFPNPIGLAAGWDKDAKAVDGVLDLGFGFTEIGSVTPIPQAGNPKPRIFRLPEEQAVINRYGFNSEGIAAVAERLGKHFGHRRTAERPEAHTSRNSGGGGESSSVATEHMRGLVAVNLGKNRTTADPASDYVQGVYTLAQYADILVVNVSSPNTPGLRKLQGRKQLQDLVKKVLAARDEMQWGEEGPPPLLVKVAPDLSPEDMADIAAVALSTKVEGLVVGNTTVSRPDCVLGLLNVEQEGGLSGRPLMDLSTHVLREMYRLTQGRIPLIGCGGVSSGQDAYEKIRAGASLVQIYTALIYQGPGVVPRIKRELAELLQRDGFKSVEEAVGADHR